MVTSQKMNAQREFFESLAAEWETRHSPERATRLRQMLAPFDSIVRDARAILEVGTGTGALVPLLRERAPTARLVSLDLAYAMLTRARARDACAAFAQADAHHLPLSAASFDLIVCHGSFPHFADHLRALSEIKRALKPGGHVLILHDIGRAQVNAIHQNAQAAAIHDDLLPQGDALRALLTQAGFDAVQVEDAADHYSASARASASDDFALVAQNVVVRYGDAVALRQVSLAVRRGEMVGLFGANGAGKSTFLKAAIGLVPLHAGTLSACGVSVSSRAFAQTRTRIGYVPQKMPNGRFPITVREAVAMGRYGLVGVGRALDSNDYARVHDALATMGITALADRLAHTLSGGQAQRVGIARALAQQPELLLLDEPTSSLDHQGQLELAQQIQILNRERGITVVIVSHTREIARLCQRIYLFEAGHVRIGEL